MLPLPRGGYCCFYHSASGRRCQPKGDNLTFNNIVTTFTVATIISAMRGHQGLPSFIHSFIVLVYFLLFLYSHLCLSCVFTPSGLCRASNESVLSPGPALSRLPADSELPSPDQLWPLVLWYETYCDILRDFSLCMFTTSAV